MFYAMNENPPEPEEAPPDLDDLYAQWAAAQDRIRDLRAQFNALGVEPCE